MNTAWEHCDRARVRGWLEEARGEAMPYIDTLPDTLIAEAQTRGMTPLDLRIWIFDNAHVEESRTVEALLGSA